MSSLLQQIRQKALDLLRRKSYTSFALQQKLLEKFSDAEEEIEIVLQECVQRNFLNDTEYAEEYVRYRQNSSPRGKMLLAQELRQKGISAEIIEETLHKISEEEEFLSLSAVANKKKQTFSSNIDTEKKKERIFRFLSSRGFSSALIWKYLDSEVENS